MSKYIPCPKCDNKMERGRILDGDRLSGAAYWAVYPWYPAPNITKREFIILAYRCLTCGFIELYARNWEKEVKDKERQQLAETKRKRQELKDERKRKKKNDKL